jgi:hypothetical protein
MTETMTTRDATKPGVAPIPARGKIVGASGGIVKFAPSNTNYVLHLAASDVTGPLNTLIEAVIRVQARKVYTVLSGGNFINPIFGPPRTIQGRVRALDGYSMIVHAGTPIDVQLPVEASAVELATGPIAVGSLVNVVAFPGATFELVK